MDVVTRIPARFGGRFATKQASAIAALVTAFTSGGCGRPARLFTFSGMWQSLRFSLL